MNQDQQKFYVLYHAECFDGRMAAWAVYDHFFGSKAEPNRRNPREENDIVMAPDVWMKFIPMSYDDPIPDIEGAIVFIVDFSDDVEKIMALADNDNQVYVLDHHLTMRDKFYKYNQANKDMGKFTHVYGHEESATNFTWESNKGHVVAHFDNRASGAALTWKFFNKNPEDIFAPTSDVPALLKYAQDYDLFTKVYQGSREIATAMYDILGDLNMEALDFMVHQFGYFNPKEGVQVNEYAKTMYERGLVIFNHQKTLARGIIKRGVRYVQFYEHKIPICPAPRELRTLVGEMLAKDHYFSISYEDYASRCIREYSFRSNKDNPNACNVKELAESFGGGGHVNASGVRINYIERGDELFPIPYSDLNKPKT